MLLEQKLVIGHSALPGIASTIIGYDSCPLIGTLKIDGQVILFWSPDVPGSRMRFAYAELTVEEVSKLASYFENSADMQARYDNHPLFMNRRVVVGLTEGWLLSQIAVIENPSPMLLDEINKLFPVPDEDE